MTAILQYRNTPIPELGLSPAQILFHRQLRDSIPAKPKLLKLHKEWIISATQREQAFADRNKHLASTYNQHANPLTPLTVRTEVMIQEKGRWRKLGRVVEVLPNRQYKIKTEGSGRITIRNRRFLKAVNKAQDLTQSPLHLPFPDIPQNPTPPLEHTMRKTQSHPQRHSLPAVTLSPNENGPSHPPPQIPQEQDGNCNSEMERQPTQKNVLKRMDDFNRKGLAETPTEGGTQSRLRGGKDY